VRRRVPIDSCPVCGGTATAPWLRSAGFELVRCLACWHRYSTELLPPEALASDYYGEASADLRARVTTEKRARSAEYEELLGGALAPAAPQAAALDVGCNAGELLEILKERGFRPFGIEVSAKAAAVARERLGHDAVIVDALERLPGEQRFELITLTHVLEHFARPRALLAALSERLVPEGRLLIEVPCADDPLLALFRGAYRPLCPGDHASFFDAESLRRLLAESGLAVLRMASPAHARDVLYPALLSTLDWARGQLRGRAGSAAADPAEGGGVAEKLRYRGRLRRPLRRMLDRACALLDPLVQAATRERSAALRGPVLIAICARASGAAAAPRG
jgi:SAM-dependent methyltransferase